MEKWKDIKGFEGSYQISSYGRVKRCERTDTNNHTWKEKILAPHRRGEYVFVHFSFNGNHYNLSVHRLVADAFCDKPSGCDIVNHIDNNPSNNRADNLEWTTYKGNMQHSAKQGRMSHKRSAESIELSAKAKRVPVIATDSDGNDYYFESQTQASKKLGVSRNHIALLCRKEYGYKQSKGYTFRYADAERNEKAIPNKVGMSKQEMAERTRRRMIGNKLSQGIPCSAQSKQASIKRSGKPVLQFDMDGNFITEYPSINAVKKELGYGLHKGLRKGSEYISHGFIWKLKSD